MLQLAAASSVGASLRVNWMRVFEPLYSRLLVFLLGSEIALLPMPT